MGAAATGVINLLTLTGDDPKAGDQPDTKPVFDIDSTTLSAMAAADERTGRAADRPQDRRARPVLHRRRRRADRSAAGLAAGQARRQGRGGRAIRPDPVLHGCRHRAALRRAPRRPRGHARPCPDRRHRAAALGEVRALDEGAPLGHHHPGRVPGAARCRRRPGGRRPAHLPRADRGVRRHPGGRRRAHHGAGQRSSGARPSSRKRASGCAGRPRTVAIASLGSTPAFSTRHVDGRRSGDRRGERAVEARRSLSPRRPRRRRRFPRRPGSSRRSGRRSGGSPPRSCRRYRDWP